MVQSCVSFRNDFIKVRALVAEIVNGIFTLHIKSTVSVI